ncbi:hypothetical protein N2152v2_000879 [Parachlorella kessleri]
MQRAQPEDLIAATSLSSEATAAQILAVQRKILAKLQEARHVMDTAQPQKASGGSVAEVVAELQHHTELLVRLKADLDAAYRKLRSIKQKLQAAFRDELEPARSVSPLSETQQQAPCRLESQQEAPAWLEDQPQPQAQLFGSEQEAGLESEKAVKQSTSQGPDHQLG